MEKQNKINPVDGQLTVIDAEGNEKLCQILFTLDSEEFGKKYVVFYPIEQLNGENDDEDQIQLMAASYSEGEDGMGELAEIETDAEWELIENAVGDFEDSCDGECHCDECEEESEEEHHCGCCHHHE